MYFNKFFFLINIFLLFVCFECSIVFAAASDQSIGNASIFYTILKDNPDSTSVKEALLFCFKHSFCIKDTNVFDLQNFFQSYEKKIKFMESLSNDQKGYILRKFVKMIEKNQINLFKLLLNEKTPYLINFLKSYVHAVQEDASLMSIVVMSKKLIGDKNRKFLMYLIALKFPLDIPDVKGYTLLHKAVLKDDVAAFDMLLSAGSNRSLRNKKGLTPYALACEKDKERIIEYCRKSDFFYEEVSILAFEKKMDALVEISRMKKEEEKKERHPRFEIQDDDRLLFVEWLSGSKVKAHDPEVSYSEIIELSFDVAMRKK